MFKFKSLPILAGAAALGTAAAFVPPAAADVVGPDFNMFVCTGCTAPPATPPADPNFINTNDFNIGIAGNKTTGNPVLVLVGPHA
jgi:hypothetical protein